MSDFRGGEHGRMEAAGGHRWASSRCEYGSVAFIECSQDVTELHFISGAHPEGTVILGVRENLENINMMPTT
jgi:hypothetical protein